ncbi:MAG: ATP-binding cassette domain-containing protein [Xanthomonadales bacterium]
MDHVSLEVEEGKSLGIAGESGCGKSTLALSLMGYYFPPLHYTGGEIIIDGRSISGMNPDDIVSADLETVNLSSTGWFAPLEDAATAFEPLVRSSENAGPMDASRLRFLADPNDLLTGFNPSGERYALVARVSGPAEAAVDAPDGAGGEHRAGAVEEGINVLLFADTDLLSDRMWVQVQPIFGATAFADNGALAINAVDNMLGNRDLISIRTRATSARPFDRVEEIRVAAEQAYRATEERLQQELQETERRLTDLQAAKGENDLLVISDEQQDEIQRFMDRRLEIRRELRQVQHDLRRDIDRLDTRIKIINIVLVPAAVMVIALAWAMRRRRRQARANAARDVTS